MPETEPHQAAIAVRDLNSHYADRQVLFDINLTVQRREIVAVMGHSGSGKTTLFRHLLGLKPPTSGQVELLGRDLTEVTRPELFELRKKIGVAFQNGALFSSLSVRQNVELPLREHTKLDENTIRIMTRMKLEFMRLAEFEKFMPAQLSGGMLKRAGLARAVIMDPQLLFFDEPSAGLDPVTSAELDRLILKLRDAMNMTIIIITHELHSAFSVADRIMVLDRGRQLMVGTREEVRASTDRRIVNMLDRKPADDDFNPDDYFNRLTSTVPKT
ncbi:MAG: ATP-binding cassette domain-containing protein [Gammaproteobacteria bacterium]|nr:ATP-binding cassette domain-containing protein [Gammaproteobacteria bacterium]